MKDYLEKYENKYREIERSGSSKSSSGLNKESKNTVNGLRVGGERVNQRPRKNDGAKIVMEEITTERRRRKKEERILNEKINALDEKSKSIEKKKERENGKNWGSILKIVPKFIELLIVVAKGIFTSRAIMAFA